jgi:hypothetical protein
MAIRKEPAIPLSAVVYEAGLRGVSTILFLDHSTLPLEGIDEHRREECEHYSACLDFVAKGHHRWRNFSCILCIGEADVLDESMRELKRLKRKTSSRRKRRSRVS